jgi:hypothetical protein
LGFSLGGVLAGTTIDGLPATSNGSITSGTLPGGLGPGTGAIAGGAGNGSVFRLHNLFWVAGDLAPLNAAFPITGSATYSGFAIGTVVSSSGGANQLSGVAQLSFDFGAKSGTFSTAFSAIVPPTTPPVSMSLSGTVNTTNRRDFSGSLTGGASLLGSGTVAGSFFRSGGPTGDPVGFAGGHFSAGGIANAVSSVTLSGVFGMSK